jgi:membrane associated rhomboid family serine protease
VFYNAVGASGAVSAVVLAGIIMFPQGLISFYFIPIEIPAWIFGIIYLLYELIMSRRAKDNIGHDAHFWGAVYGIILTLAFKHSLGVLFLHNSGILR